MDVNVVLLLIGLAFFAAGLLILVRQLKSRRNNTASAMAEVTGYHTELHHSADDDGDSYVYYPILRYFASGQWHEGKGDTGRGRKKYDIGERVGILYDPKHPESFLIAGDKTALTMSVIAAAIGVGICLLSFFG